MEYRIEIIHSQRKTIGLEVKADGRVILRVPYRMTKRSVDQFLREHQDWIEAHRQKVLEAQKKAPKVEMLTEEQIRYLVDKAIEVIPQRVAYYAPLVGVTYGRITIRCQKTRWGSCSSKGNLNFNYLLMLAPPEVVDSVVVHELCHRKEMNHSKRFYEEVYRVLPEYDKSHKWLKENGAALMRRVRK